MTAASLFAVWLCGVASAQAVSVQQPQFERFSATTTVVVPDRGETVLGGISRAAEWRSRIGPLPVGTAAGWERSHSGLSVRAGIHDLRAMDEALRAQPTVAANKQADIELQGMARLAWEQLLRRAGSRPAARVTARVSESSARTAARRGYDQSLDVRKSGPAQAARFVRLGWAAEERGDIRLARLYYRMAQKHGSVAAAQRLKSLDSSRTVEANRQVRASQRTAPERLR